MQLTEHMPETALTEPPTVAEGLTPSSLTSPTPLERPGISWFWRCVRAPYRFLSLLAILAIAATIPVLQWASLGYLLEVSRRRATGRAWRDTLPGLGAAGQIGWTAIAILVTGLPALLIAQFAYQAGLIAPGSDHAARWRMAAVVVGFTWLIHCLWALMRGGRWRDFLWPAPIRFVREFFRPSTWRQTEDQLWEFITSLRIPYLVALGFRGWLGALIWLAIPASLMILGLQAEKQPVLTLFGAIGFLMMWVVLLYLPFLQTQLAISNRLRDMFRIRSIRQAFRNAPWAFLIALFLTLGLAIPLYLFRIEVLPPELLWLPAIVFILFGLPSRIALGWAMCRSARAPRKAWWPSRYLAWMLQIAITPIYILFLYLGTLATWDGPLSVFLQHAFLTPVPFTP